MSRRGSSSYSYPVFFALDLGEPRLRNRNLCVPMNQAKPSARHSREPRHTHSDALVSSWAGTTATGRACMPRCPTEGDEPLPSIRRGVKAAPQIMVLMVQVRSLAAELLAPPASR